MLYRLLSALSGSGGLRSGSQVLEDHMYVVSLMPPCLQPLLRRLNDVSVTDGD